MIKPKVCILRTDGTNCDEELFYAFEKFGAAPEYVHINQLRTKSSPSGVLTKGGKRLKAYHIMALPGGFAYGDDIASGKILAVELISFLKDQLIDFINRQGLILGICNGFQTLVRTGLLPFGKIGKMDATLAPNESGHFECRWINLKREKSRCVFLPDPVSLYSDTGSSQSESVFQLPVNHGEGKFFATNDILRKIENEDLVVFRYVDEKGKPTQKYPANPNGSQNAIAAICDLSGRILAIMPHPEKFVDATQHPNWRRIDKNIKPHGSVIFENMVDYVKNA